MNTRRQARRAHLVTIHDLLQPALFQLRRATAVRKKEI
jgi:hypothetical protein